MCFPLFHHHDFRPSVKMIVIASSYTRLTFSHNSLQVGSISQPIPRCPFAATRADDGGSPVSNNSCGGQHDFGATAIRTSGVVRRWRRIIAASAGDRDVGDATAPPGRQLINPISKEVSFSLTLSLSSLSFCPPMFSIVILLTRLRFALQDTLATENVRRKRARRHGRFRST